MSFDVGGFYIRYTNRLGRLTTQTPAGPTFFYTNISNSRNVGAELFVEADVLALASGATGKQQLFVFASMAPISARYMKGPVTGNRVEFSSSFIGRWGGTYKRGGFSGTLQYSRTGDQFTDANNTVLLPDASQGYIPEQKVMDLTANYGINQNYILTLGINNLLDNKYFTRRASAYPGPGLIGADGRTLNVAVTVKSRGLQPLVCLPRRIGDGRRGRQRISQRSLLDRALHKRVAASLGGAGSVLDTSAHS